MLAVFTRHTIADFLWEGGSDGQIGYNSGSERGRNNATTGWHELTNIITRAIELANTGKYRQISELEKTLMREGYEDVYDHLGGKQTRRHLLALMKNASGPTSASSKKAGPTAQDT